MYKHIFGPVPSRRLGMSLGVDLVPSKVCSLDCVYCEVGKTTKLTCERKPYIPCEKVKEELKDYFAHNPDPDYVTFSGAGEPTLNIHIGEILDFIKELRPSVPVAVLTNGTLFDDKAVRDSLLKADLVMPSLDAVSNAVFQKINRPVRELNIETCIQGLIDFSHEFQGTIHLEIFILPGYNDTPDEISKFKETILKIKPDAIQLNTLDRPGTIANLHAATHGQLQQIKELWGLDNVEIISRAPDRKNIVSYRTDIETAILETIRRRPCTLHDLADLLGRHINEINKYLDVLEDEKKVKTTRQARGLFYQTTD